MEGTPLPGPGETAFDDRTRLFMDESTRIQARTGSGELTPMVGRTLEQARRDLAALRLYDLDHGERAWTMAAGLPVYVALFGRDTQAVAWQAGLLGPEPMRGALLELARWQGTTVNAGGTSSRGGCCRRPTPARSRY